MNAMLLLIPISLLLVALSIWAFFWAVDQDQFESLDRAALEALDREVPDPLEPPLRQPPLRQPPLPETPPHD